MNQILPLMLATFVGLSSSTIRTGIPAAGVELGPIGARTGLIVSTEWLEQHLGDGVIVVEAGADRREFRAAHIRGARFLDWRLIAVESRSGVHLPDVRELESSLASLGVGNEGRIVIYSRDPRVATWTWFVLDYLGHGDRAGILDGGWQKWLSEGRPITGGEFVPGQASFETKLRPAVVIELEELRVELSRRGTSRPFVIDARTVEEYRGEVRGQKVGRVGHIPGAHSVTWTRNLEIVGGSTVFRLPEALRAIYLREQTTMDPHPIVYCRTGLDASVTYFVLRVLGLEPRIYDGSFIEWSAVAELPVGRAASVKLDSAR